jgi:hypothetical protein
MAACGSIPLMFVYECDPTMQPVNLNLNLYHHYTDRSAVRFAGASSWRPTTGSPDIGHRNHLKVVANPVRHTVECWPLRSEAVPTPA